MVQSNYSTVLLKKSQTKSNIEKLYEIKGENIIYYWSNILWRRKINKYNFIKTITRNKLNILTFISSYLYKFNGIQNIRLENHWN